MACRLGGRFLLRIEDIDIARCRPEFESAIYDDLAWLGLEWERPVRRQSEHLADHGAALQRLNAAGLLYPCFASRAEIAAAVASREASGQPWARDPDGSPVYPGLHKHLSASQRDAFEASGRPHALRLDMAEAIRRAGNLDWTEMEPDGAASRVSARPEEWGDVVIARKDVPTSYHLAVVVDDALQGITHVTRGRDLFEATSVHRLLQSLLGLPQPIYSHHRLVTDEAGRKLSKSSGDTSLRALRNAGATPQDIKRMVDRQRNSEGA